MQCETYVWVKNHEPETANDTLNMKKMLTRKQYNVLFCVKFCEIVFIDNIEKT